jgi:pyrroline-5-carboxylate reductase
MSTRAPLIRFIGGGNMASALIGGLVNTGHPADRVQVIEPDAAARTRLHVQSGVSANANAEGLPACDIAVLAVKPQLLRGVAREHAASLTEALVVSVAAGIRLPDLARWLGGHSRIVRAMPNTPALVGHGVTGLAASAGVSDGDRSAVQALFDAVGTVVWVDGDAGIDLVTAISGSGPAYMMLMVEALTEAGVGHGEVARQPRPGRRVGVGGVGAAERADEVEHAVLVEVDPRWTLVRAVKPAVAGDVSGDGRIDAVDWMELALRAGTRRPDTRRVDTGFDPLYDVNDDGTVDDDDFDAVVP